MYLGKEGGPTSKAHRELGRLSRPHFGVVPIGWREAWLFGHLHTYNPAFLRVFPHIKREWSSLSTPRIPYAQNKSDSIHLKGAPQELRHPDWIVLPWLLSLSSVYGSKVWHRPLAFSAVALTRSLMKFSVALIAKSNSITWRIGLGCLTHTADEK